MLDVRGLASTAGRHGGFLSARVTWSLAGHVIDALDVTLVIAGRDASMRWSSVESLPATGTVTLTSAPLPWGGVRWFAACPACGAAVAHLYRVAGLDALACRRCHGLLHRSTRERRTFAEALRRYERGDATGLIAWGPRLAASAERHRRRGRRIPA